MEEANEVRGAHHQGFATRPNRQATRIKIIMDARCKAVESKTSHVNLASMDVRGDRRLGRTSAQSKPWRVKKQSCQKQENCCLLIPLISGHCLSSSLRTNCEKPELTRMSCHGSEI